MAGLDANAIMQSSWWNDAGVPASQPVSAPPMSFVPAMNMSPMPAFNPAGITPESLSFGGMNTSVDMLSPQMTQATTQIAQPQQGWGAKAGSWLSNGDNLGTVFQGLGALTNAYLGFKQLSMAKDNLAFQKDAFNKNFENSQQTYNTSLEDRIRGRTSSYAGKESDVQSYLAKHRLGG